MTDNRKKILTTGWAVLGGIGTLCSLVENVPKVLETVFSRGPQWLSNPHVWPTIVVLVATSIAIYLTWRWPSDPERPSGSERPSDPESSDDALRKFASTVSNKCFEIACLYVELKEFYKLVMKACLHDRANPEFVFKQLEIVQPARIKPILGKRIHDQFVSLVKDAKDRSQGDEKIVCEAAFDYAHHKIWKSIFSEVDKKLGQTSGMAGASVQKTRPH